MAKRLFDIIFSLLALVLLAPLFVLAAIGIRLSSPGPLLYRARRVGHNGETFMMHKFRTMHHRNRAPGSAITGANDPRVFAIGCYLRKLKIDELPQLYDVLRGRMSIVGPRPEDPQIVSEHYTTPQRETLRVAPGLASPGSIYNYTHGELMLDGDDPEKYYIQQLLPVKLALDVIYVREASFLYAARVVLRTLWVILSKAVGRQRFPDPPEMKKARQLLILNPPG